MRCDTTKLSVYVTTGSSRTKWHVRWRQNFFTFWRSYLMQDARRTFNLSQNWMTTDCNDREQFPNLSSGGVAQIMRTERQPRPIVCVIPPPSQTITPDTIWQCTIWYINYEIITFLKSSLSKTQLIVLWQLTVISGLWFLGEHKLLVRVIESRVIAVGCSFVHGQCWRLTIVLSAVVAHVWLCVGVYNMMLVQTWVFREALSTAMYCTYVWLLSCRQISVTYTCERPWDRATELSALTTRSADNGKKFVSL